MMPSYPFAPFFLLLATASASLSAAPLSLENTTQALDSLPPLITPHPDDSTNLPAASPKAPSNEVKSIHYNEADFSAHPELTEYWINQAIIHQDMALLSALLPIYEKQAPNSNSYHYASAVLARSQHHYHQAITHFQAFLQAKPDLLNVRFDYAVTLFEDKQWQAAEREMQYIIDHSAPQAFKQLAQRYQQAIQENQALQSEIGLNYTTTDNVNNAADSKEIYLNGKTWQRNEESLPQSANGIEYSLSLHKSQNIQDHHYLGTGLQLNGIYYWNNEIYNQENIRLYGQYRHQSYWHSTSLEPFFAYTRFQGQSYNHESGFSLRHHEKLNERWLIQAQYTYGIRRYHTDSIAERYNAHYQQAALLLAWQASAHTLLYSGIDFSHEHTQDPSEASSRQGIRLGISQQWQQGWGWRFNTRYGTRHFEAPHFLAGYTRRDQEWQAELTLWHHKINWHGFTPVLNYRYTFIQSNIPDLYQRRNQQWFITLEKSF